MQEQLDTLRAAFVLRATDDVGERVRKAMRAVDMSMGVLVGEGLTPLSLAAHSQDDQAWALRVVRALSAALLARDEALAEAFRLSSS